MDEIEALEGCCPSVMEAFVREKRFWLYTKLALTESLRHPGPTKEYVNGEGFPYLGKSYRLMLVDEQEVLLKLDHGRFKLLRAEAEHGRLHFVRWYTKHGRRWLSSRAKRFEDRVGVKPSGVEVRDLGSRWGSCGKNGTLNFHWATMTLPVSVVEYVVVHELIHLLEPHHTPAFWNHVERVLSGYETRKQWLAEKGGAFVVL